MLNPDKPTTAVRLITQDHYIATHIYIGRLNPQAFIDPCNNISSISLPNSTQVHRLTNTGQASGVTLTIYL